MIHLLDYYEMVKNDMWEIKSHQLKNKNNKINPLIIINKKIVLKEQIQHVHPIHPHYQIILIIIKKRKIIHQIHCLQWIQ